MRTSGVSHWEQAQFYEDSASATFVHTIFAITDNATYQGGAPRTINGAFPARLLRERWPAGYRSPDQQGDAYEFSDGRLEISIAWRRPGMSCRELPALEGGEAAGGWLNPRGLLVAMAPVVLQGTITVSRADQLPVPHGPSEMPRRSCTARIQACGSRKPLVWPREEWRSTR